MNKTQAIALALIGSAVVAGELFNQKLIRDLKRETTKMKQDRVTIQETLVK